MPEGKGEMPTSPEARKPEAQKPFQPSWIIGREDEFAGMNPSLQLRVRQIHQAPESIAGRNYLEKHYLALEEQVVEGKIPEDEAGIVLAKIVARIEELESQQGVRPESSAKKAQTVSAGPDRTKEQSLSQVEELIKKTQRGERLTPEEERKLYSSPYLRDYETGGAGIPGLPDVREIGEGALRDLFLDRLRNLIEEQADQSFDQNWRLVYPLEMTIMSLYPRRGEKEIISPEIINKEGKKEKEEVNLPVLRRKLSVELQSYRNIHNFIYVYRRVGGVTPLIEAASLLPRETINVLLKTPEVADRLRKIEALGERNFQLKTKEYEGTSLTNDEKNELKEIEAKVKELMVKPSTGGEVRGDFWANRIAGGLYSGLHESARHDLQVNESGDFFSDRLFHTKERAKGMWEKTWRRSPRPNLYETVDLRLTGFWEKVLGSKVGSFKTVSEAEKYCESMGINAVIDERINEETGRKNPVLVSFDLSGAKFEGMVFSEVGIRDELKVKTDEVRQTNIDLDDADKVRKAIFDPRGFLDDPSMATIKKAYEIFKHLKGERRSDWVRNVCREVILLYRDTVHPWNESASPRSRKCPGREIYPEMVPWTNNEVKNQLTRMTPPLTDTDREKVLEEFVGTKAQRRLKEDVQVAKEVGKGMLGEFLKALFGLK